MKNYIAFLLSAFFVNVVVGQTTTSTPTPSATAITQTGQTSIYGQYVWTQSTRLFPCNFKGESVGIDTPILSIPLQRFKVVKVAGDSLIILVLQYAKDTARFYQYNYFGLPTDYNILKKSPTTSTSVLQIKTNTAYFKIPKEDLSNYATKDTKVKGGLAFGVLSFPFKFRPQKGRGDFAGSFNFGAAIGYKFPHRIWRDWNFSVLTGYSISNITLDSVSVSQNSAKLVSTNNFTAFSFSVGGLIEYNKVQVGVFIGWDKISRINQLEYGWLYQGRPWLSVGFGYSIFSVQTASTTSDTKQ